MAPTNFRFTWPSIHDVKWIAVDIKGNVSPVQSQRFLIGPDGDVGGTVPATLSLSLGSLVSFGAFTPGVPRECTATQTATVISTGRRDADRRDLTANHPGHLVHGAFFLPEPLQGLER